MILGVIKMSGLYRYFYGEKINMESSLNHLNDPVWFDKNWNKFVKSVCRHSNVDRYVNDKLFRTNNTEVLEVFRNHQFDFSRIKACSFMSYYKNSRNTN